MTSLTENLITWIRDYLNSFGGKTKAVIGLSGGKDSTVCAALCVKAVGPNRVFGVLMPQGDQHDHGVALSVAAFLDIGYTDINIANIQESFDKGLNALYYNLNPMQRVDMSKYPVYTTNNPARIRMSLLYAVAAMLGDSRVVNTCNRSEDYVGYSTKFGDAAGDFSPLSNLCVREVLAIGEDLGLPTEWVHKPPEDGLSGKTDEDNLGFSYKTLDNYLLDQEYPRESILNKINKKHKVNLHKIQPMPAFNPSLENLMQTLKENNFTLGSAESISAGGIGATLAQVPGVSQYYKGGIIVYSNMAKTQLLGVDAKFLHKQGPYNAETVHQMCKGLLKRLDVDVAVAVSGVAGPGDDGFAKEGDVWFGVAVRTGKRKMKFWPYFYNFQGNRVDIQKRTVETAYQLIVDTVNKVKGELK